MTSEHTHKVLICCKALAPYRVDLYRQVSKQFDHQVKVLVGDKPAYHAWDSLECDDLDVEMMKVGKIPVKYASLVKLTSENKGSTLLPSKDYLNQIKDFAPTHVWVHEMSPLSLLAIRYAKQHKCKLILSTELGESIQREYSKFTCFLHKKFGKRADVIIANSAAAKEPLSGRKERVVFAPHAVYTEDYEPNTAINKGELRLLFVGNMIERKGVDLLLEAIARVRPVAERSNVKISLSIAGGGNKKWVEELVEKFDLIGDIDFLGFLQGEDLKQAYGAADVLVLPSRFDSYGVVTHEGMCAGLALLISDACGSAEILVQDGVNGFVAKSHSVDSIEEKLIQFVENISELQSYKKASLALAGQHCVSEVAKRIHAKIADIDDHSSK